MWVCLAACLQLRVIPVTSQVCLLSGVWHSGLFLRDQKNEVMKCVSWHPLVKEFRASGCQPNTLFESVCSRCYWPSLVLETRKGRLPKRRTHTEGAWGFEALLKHVQNSFWVVAYYSLLQCFGFLCFCRHLLASFHLVCIYKKKNQNKNQAKQISIRMKKYTFFGQSAHCLFFFCRGCCQ